MNVPLETTGLELNEPQREAVAHVDGPLLIFAGAGSGKTRVIVYRIANLIAAHRVPPHRVLAVTFTNKAAGEMRHRLERLIGEELAKDLWVGTFHSVCVRLLRRYPEALGLGHNFVIYDDSAQRSVMNRVVKELKLDDRRFPPRQMLAQVHAAKQEGKGPDGVQDKVVTQCFEAYERHLKAANAADFDDLLLGVLRTVEDPGSAQGKELRARFRHVLVDEFQDANQVQYRLVRALSTTTRNLCVVGDDDQCHPPGVVITTAFGLRMPVEQLYEGFTAGKLSTVLGWHCRAEALAPRRVEVSVRPFSGLLYDVEVDGLHVPVTGNHRLWVRVPYPAYGSFRHHEVTAETLFKYVEGGYLRGVELPLERGGWAPLAQIKAQPYVGPVYSLDVDGDHAYAANGIIVLNSIYKWRGADVRIVRGFRHDFPDATIVKLEQNYRSTGHVVKGALGVIRPAKDREPKELWTANQDGDRISVVAADNEHDEAAFVVERIRELQRGGVSLRDIAVFYRIHAMSRVLEEVMLRERIPYQIIGGMRFFERAEIKDALAYLRIVDNPKSDVDLLRIINTPSRKIGATTIERLVQEADERRSSLFEALAPLADGDALGGQAKKALSSFRELLLHLMSARGDKTVRPSKLCEEMLERTGYTKMLESNDSAEAETRMQNLRELVGSILVYEEETAASGETPSLSDYLERVTLASDTDTLEDKPRVAMMTVHAAKGLEFDSVFVTGMEEDLFPFRSLDQRSDEKDDIEEERRLAYVAVTRARRRLWITHAARRAIFGTTRYGVVSRFIHDLPNSSVARILTASLADRANHHEPSYTSCKSSRGPSGPPNANAAPPRITQNDPHRPDEPSGKRLDSANLRHGAHVRHETFGVGVVQDVEESDDPIVTVKFSGYGPKRIKAHFLRIE